MKHLISKLDGIWNRKFTRRDFLKSCISAGLGASVSLYALDLLTKYRAYASIPEKRGMREALFYEKAGGGSVRCLLCPNQCFLSEGQRGFCRVREPVDGKLYTLVYELICSLHVDPIEKKPLFHVLPSSKALSTATAGCNSRCKYCQNWTISQRAPEETNNRYMSCSDLTATALANDCSSIAYTYTEPIVFFEYVLDSSAVAREKGLLNIIVTGGKANPEPLKRLCSAIDAANVDLKGFDPDFLREVCAQDLDNILGNLRIMKQQGVWIELTNLIVPTLNDNMNTIRKMVVWIRDNLGPDVPLHFSRFWPQYKLRSLYPTPVETLSRAREIALGEGLRYVYLGNVPERRAESTVCPSCGNTVIERIGYKVLKNDMRNGNCGSCGHPIPGIWRGVNVPQAPSKKTI